MIDNLIRLIVCALGVGALVRAFAVTWKPAFKVAVTPREQAYFAAAVSGYLAGFQFFRDYRLAAKMSLLVIGGYFGLKWITHVLDQRFRS
jgi:hypothetical protein